MVLHHNNVFPDRPTIRPGIWMRVSNIQPDISTLIDSLFANLLSQSISVGFSTKLLKGSSKILKNLLF